MAVAYRLVALPTAAVVGGLSLISLTIMEIRHYRHAKVLAEIERAG
jgi:hypothetical protein